VAEYQAIPGTGVRHKGVECDTLRRLFNGNNGVTHLFQSKHRLYGIGGVLPRNRLGGAKGGFLDFTMWWLAGYAGKNDLFQTESVGGSEGGTHIVETSNIVEQDTHRDLFQVPELA